MVPLPAVFALRGDNTGPNNGPADTAPRPDSTGASLKNPIPAGELSTGIAGRAVQAVRIEHHAGRDLGASVTV